MLIGTAADDLPKALYGALGFVPQCLTRQYLRDQPASSARARLSSC